MDRAIGYGTGKPPRRQFVRSTIAAMAACVVGCKREKTPSGSAAVPVAPIAVAKPVLTLPAESTLVIDGHASLFPAAQLMAQSSSPLTLRLFSKDGPAGGNSFYMQIVLDQMEDGSMLNGAVWEFSQPPERAEDSLTTILLFGGISQLQPQEVTVAFAAEDRRVRATLGGRWGLFTNAEAQVPDRAVLVTGVLMALLEQE